MNMTRVFGAGLLASIVMGMVEMVFEATAGPGFWSPLVFIAATVLRPLQSVPIPVPFMALPVVLGLMGHMMNSMILGLVFGVISSRFAASRGVMVGAGVGYALLVFAMAWYLVLPVIDPVMLKLNAVFFAVAHVMWGAALGLTMPGPAERAARLTAA
jgi:hypothetical protein